MLITPEYAALNAELHRTTPEYGSKGYKSAKVLDRLQARFSGKTILDYGSGKGGLKYHLSIRAHDKPIYTVFEYEPALGIDERQQCDFVTCRAVLEHVEPECLDAVLQDIHRLTLMAAYFSVGTRKSGEYLPDGRNAHQIIESPKWWETTIRRYFLPFETSTKGRKFDLLVTPC